MVPGQDGPHIEEDEMYPSMTQGLAAERIREWRAAADIDRMVKDARRARDAAPVSAARRLRLLIGSGSRAVAARPAGEQAGAAGQRRAAGRRAA
ncbi:MAG TPA: hypothetical protein VMI33_14655 [Streptosporangiaceae bacterium]|nr:hypothetical protein [Streptosporangiaceae bacterium]